MRYLGKIGAFVFCLFLLLGFVEAGVCYPNFLALGPEFYLLKRTRDGGAKQDGWIIGGRISYDRIKPYRLYLGGDFLYATGKLTGKTATGKEMLSSLTDENGEVRIGITLQQEGGRCFFIVPFVGYGFFRETNDFFPLLLSLVNLLIAFTMQLPVFCLE